MRKYTIVTDSTSDLPAGLIESLGVKVAPTQGKALWCSSTWALKDR